MKLPVLVLLASVAFALPAEARSRVRLSGLDRASDTWPAAPSGRAEPRAVDLGPRVASLEPGALVAPLVSGAMSSKELRQVGRGALVTLVFTISAVVGTAGGAIGLGIAGFNAGAWGFLLGPLGILAGGVLGLAVGAIIGALIGLVIALLPDSEAATGQELQPAAPEPQPSPGVEPDLSNAPLFGSLSGARAPMRLLALKF